MNYRALGVPVTIGVGATIDFLAGHVKRAPHWMQRSGLEWVFRLLQEPQRLYRRYSKDIRVFGFRIIGQLWTLRRKLVVPHNSPLPAIPGPDSNDPELLRLPEILDLAEAKRLRTEWGGRAVIDSFADASKVRFVDSAGLGVLMDFAQKINSADKHLILIRPSSVMRRALRFTRLDTFFDCAPTVKDAQEILRAREQENLRRVALHTGSPFRALVWYGEITAVNADDVWERTRNYIEQAASVASEATEPLVVDMSVVRFIDSSGLGLMVRVRKFSRQAGLTLRFTNLQSAVMNVIQIARLEEFLLDQKRSRFPLLARTKTQSTAVPKSKEPVTV
jgi:N-acetylglucosaminyldiphosphoundecaprenol N-acetyl-beta-D-mannosaminyltransferase